MSLSKVSASRNVKENYKRLEAKARAGGFDNDPKLKEQILGRARALKHGKTISKDVSLYGKKGGQPEDGNLLKSLREGKPREFRAKDAEKKPLNRLIKQRSMYADVDPKRGVMQNYYSNTTPGTDIKFDIAKTTRRRAKQMLGEPLSENRKERGKQISRISKTKGGKQVIRVASKDKIKDYFASAFNFGFNDRYPSTTGKDVAPVHRMVNTNGTGKITFGRLGYIDDAKKAIAKRRKDLESLEKTIHTKPKIVNLPAHSMFRKGKIDPSIIPVKTTAIQETPKLKAPKEKDFKVKLVRGGASKQEAIEGSRILNYIKNNKIKAGLGAIGLAGLAYGGKKLYDSSDKTRNTK